MSTGLTRRTLLGSAASIAAGIRFRASQVSAGSQPARMFRTGAFAVEIGE